jgi:CelD/BcsL family acetyltransferase involved in cellulose biosynthesis
MTQTMRAALERDLDARVTGREFTAPVMALRPDVQLSLHSGLVEVEAEWRTFEMQADCTAFQSFDWLSAWQRHIGTGEGRQPAIVVGRQNGQTLFILPLMLSAGTLRRVEWLGEFLINAGAPLLARDFAKRVSAAQFKVLWGEIEALLRGHLNHDLLDLGKIPETVGAQANPMRALAMTPHANDSYLVRLTGTPNGTCNGTWDEFYAAKRSSSWRKTDKKKRNRLAKFGDVQFATVTERADIERTIDALIEQKKSSYASLGVANMFEWPGYRDFYIDLATDPKRHGLVHVSNVSVGGTIVAASFGLTMHGNYDYVLAGYSMGEMEACSPGTIHLQELMKLFLDRGFATFDFNIGDEPYKREWFDVETTMFDYVAPATLRGQAAAATMRVSREIKRFIKRNPAIWPVIRKARSMIGSLR